MNITIQDIISELPSIAKVVDGQETHTGKDVISKLSYFQEKDKLVSLELNNVAELTQAVALFANIARISSDATALRNNAKSALDDAAVRLYGTKAKKSDLSANDIYAEQARIQAISPGTIAIELTDIEGVKDAVAHVVELVVEANRGLFTTDGLLSQDLAGKFFEKQDLSVSGPITCAASITSHPVKYDERVSVKQSLLVPARGAEGDHGIHSGATVQARRLTFSGNAADLGHRPMLLLEYNYQGAQTSLIEMIATNHPDMRQVFANLGVSEEKTKEIFEFVAKSTGALDHAVGKQIFFPVGGQTMSYCTISPVISASMQRALLKKLFTPTSTEDGSDLFYINSEVAIIGGAQAQNASSMNAALGGRNRMLSFTMPPTTPLSELQSRLINGKSLIRENGPIGKPLKGSSFHYQERRHFRKCVYQWCEHALSLLYAYAAKKDELNEAGFKAKVEIEDLVASGEPLSRQDLSVLESALAMVLFRDMASAGSDLPVDVKQKAQETISHYVRRVI